MSTRMSTPVAPDLSKGKILFEEAKVKPKVPIRKDDAEAKLGPRYLLFKIDKGTILTKTEFKMLQHIVSMTLKLWRLSKLDMNSEDTPKLMKTDPA
jgi:hypothetical protein